MRFHCISRRLALAFKFVLMEHKLFVCIGLYSFWLHSLADRGASVGNGSSEARLALISY